MSEKATCFSKVRYEKRVSHKENCYSNCEGECQLVKRSRKKLSSG